MVPHAYWQTQKFWTVTVFKEKPMDIQMHGPTVLSPCYALDKEFNGLRNTHSMFNFPCADFWREHLLVFPN